MNEDHTHHDKLHLHADPDTQRIESLLDAIGQSDRDAMTSDAEARILDSVSQVFAPTPIAIDRAGAQPSGQSQRFHFNLRMAAAAAIAGFATLGLVISQPWSTGTGTPETTSPNQGTWSLASFEEDLDVLLTLEDGLDDSQIEEAVADWELWAQTIEADMSADAFADEFGLGNQYEGAI